VTEALVSVRDLESKLITAQASLPQFQSTISELKTHKTQLEKRQESELTKIAPQTSHKLSEQTSIEAQMQAPLLLSRALTQKIESHKNRLDLIQKSEQANTGKLDKFQERINDCLLTFENHQSEYQQYKNAIDEIDQRLKDSVNGDESALLELKKINDEIVDSDLKIQETRALVDGRIVGNKTLEFLEGAWKRGALKGFLGRLGDLGSVDKKYDVAVSNGFGWNWDAI
jgi:structural maintenance of chromosome 4